MHPSMGSVGGAYESALWEPLLASFERELAGQHCFRNQAEARMAVFGFNQGW